MKNIRLTISYDGSKFYGFQRQPDKRTVQGEIEEAVYKVSGQRINIIPCGRTDAGVHALKHILNFMIDTDLPAEAFKFMVERQLDRDIVIINSEEVDLEFHSRFDCKEKTYRYILRNADYPLPYERHYKEFFRKELDVEKMRNASLKLLGEHDFSAFIKWNDYKNEEINTIRSLDRISVDKVGHDIIFEFAGESFLHNQIRITVGLLVDIGRGYRDIDYIDDIFSGKVNRAAKTLGPEGLYLIDVKY